MQPIKSKLYTQSCFLFKKKKILKSIPYSKIDLGPSFLPNNTSGIFKSESHEQFLSMFWVIYKKIIWLNDMFGSQQDFQKTNLIPEMTFILSKSQRGLQMKRFALYSVPYKCPKIPPSIKEKHRNIITCYKACLFFCRLTCFYIFTHASLY